MEFPKPIMKKSELIKIGFSNRELMIIFNRKNQKVAWKMSSAVNSPIMFDTTELKKLIYAKCGR